MFNKEKFQMDILNTKVPEELDLTVGEMYAIYELGKDPFSLISNAFICGLIKGGVI